MYQRAGYIYLHNRVESLEEIKIKLQQLVPEMSIDTAHGQMSASELDDIFRRFKMGGFHVLIATTIIENSGMRSGGAQRSTRGTIYGF